MGTGAARYDALLRDTAVALTAAGIDNARFEARLLLAHAAGVTIEWLIAQGVPFTTRTSKSGTIEMHLTREGGHGAIPCGPL